MYSFLTLYNIKIKFSKICFHALIAKQGEFEASLLKYPPPIGRRIDLDKLGTHFT